MNTEHVYILVVSMTPGLVATENALASFSVFLTPMVRFVKANALTRATPALFAGELWDLIRRIVDEVLQKES